MLAFYCSCKLAGCTTCICLQASPLRETQMALEIGAGYRQSAILRDRRVK